MEELLLQIEKALAAQAYYGALFMSLCVPDICAALNASNGETSGSKYIAWVDANFKDSLELDEEAGDFYKGMGTAINGANMYYLRCSALHQGRAEHKKSTFSKIIIQEPGQRLIVAHGLVNSGVLYLNLTELCKDIVLSTRKWLENIRGTEPFETNYASMLSRHPDGLQPYCKGFPVIATP